MFLKFGIKMSKFNRIENWIHFPQLFLAMQYHCGTTFVDKQSYLFCDSSQPSPLLDCDLMCSGVVNYKINMVVPGLFNRCCSDSTSREALLAFGMYPEALNTTKAQLSLLNISIDKLATKTPKHLAEISLITYHMCLSLYLSGQFTNTIQIVRDFLCQNSKFLAISGRMMSLLMCAEFKLGHISEAVTIYDAGIEVYSFCLGSFHPIIAVHMCTLADLYRDAKSNCNARIMMTLAFELSKVSLGENHGTCAHFGKKLSILCLEHCSFVEALQIIRHSIATYESCLQSSLLLKIDSARIQRDVIECLYLKAVAYSELNELPKAMSVCNQVMLSSVNFEDSGIPIEIFAAHILMSDLYFRNKESSIAITVLRKALQLLRSSQIRGINATLTIANLTRKILQTCLTSQTFQIRSFIDAKMSEWSVSNDNRMFDLSQSREFDQDWTLQCETILNDLWIQYPDDCLLEIINCVREEELLSLGDIDFDCNFFV